MLERVTTSSKKALDPNNDDDDDDIFPNFVLRTRQLLAGENKEQQPTRKRNSHPKQTPFVGPLSPSANKRKGGMAHSHAIDKSVASKEQKNQRGDALRRRQDT